MKTLLCFSILLLIVSAFHCNNDSVVVQRADAGGRFSLALEAVPAGIAQVVARLSRHGYDDRLLTLTIADSGAGATGTLNDVPVGMWRLFVSAFDDQGHVRYADSTDVDVQGGLTTHVDLQLSPTTGNVEIVVTWGGSCVTSPPGLVSWWPGDGSAGDVLGRNNGALINGATFASGKVGQAFQFDGVNDFVRVPSSASLSPTGSFSIDAWIYPTAETLGVIVYKWSDEGEWAGQRSYALELHTDRSVGFAISDLAHQNDLPFHVFYTEAGLVDLNSWSHIAAVYHQPTGTRRIYVNGTKVAERTDPPITVLAGIADLTIGAKLISPSRIGFGFPGRIDEVDLFDKALSDSEVRSIYLAGSAGKCW